MQEVPEQMSLENLEKVLKHLPEPNSVEVGLFNFDLSSTYDQAQRLAKHLELNPLKSQSLKTTLENPSKEKILQIYESEMKRIDQLKENTKVSNQGFISFKEAIWNPKGLRINLNPFKVLVEYSGSKPDYLDKMTNELGTDVEYRVTQRPYLRSI